MAIKPIDAPVTGDVELAISGLRWEPAQPVLYSAYCAKLLAIVLQKPNGKPVSTLCITMPAL